MKILNSIGNRMQAYKFLWIHGNLCEQMRKSQETNLLNLKSMATEKDNN